MQTLSPLILDSDAFTLNAQGASFSVPPYQLANPNREAMLIDEMRFGISASSVAANLKAVPQLRANIMLGNAQLTDPFIPVVSFAPIYSDPYLVGINAPQFLVWHFSKPLYVPPNVQISAFFQRKNPFPGGWDPNDGTIFSFSMAGRSVPNGMPSPKRIYVPYACAMTCNSAQYDSTTGETANFTSGDRVGNPFDSDLFMQYMSGMNNTVGTIGPSPCQVLVQATYASGKMLIRDQTPFGVLFPPFRPVARLQGRMKPKDFLKFTLSLNPIVGADDSANDINFTTIGMSGYRLMDTPMSGTFP